MDHPCAAAWKATRKKKRRRTTTRQRKNTKEHTKKEKEEKKRRKERERRGESVPEQTAAGVRSRAASLQVYMRSLPLNQGTGWINNTIDIPVMRSQRTSHNYFIVAVMRAPARPVHSALPGSSLLEARPKPGRGCIDHGCCILMMRVDVELEAAAGEGLLGILRFILQN